MKFGCVMQFSLSLSLWGWSLVNVSCAPGYMQSHSSPCLPSGVFKRLAIACCLSLSILVCFCLLFFVFLVCVCVCVMAFAVLPLFFLLQVSLFAVFVCFWCAARVIVSGLFSGLFLMFCFRISLFFFGLLFLVVSCSCICLCFSVLSWILISLRVFLVLVFQALPAHLWFRQWN